MSFLIESLSILPTRWLNCSYVFNSIKVAIREPKSGVKCFFQLKKAKIKLLSSYKMSNAEKNSFKLLRGLLEPKSCFSKLLDIILEKVRKVKQRTIFSQYIKLRISGSLKWLWKKCHKTGLYRNVPTVRLIKYFHFRDQ